MYYLYLKHASYERIELSPRTIRVDTEITDMNVFQLASLHGTIIDSILSDNIGERVSEWAGFNVPNNTLQVISADFFYPVNRRPVRAPGL